MSKTNRKAAARPKPATSPPTGGNNDQAKADEAKAAAEKEAADLRAAAEARAAAENKAREEAVAKAKADKQAAEAKAAAEHEDRKKKATEEARAASAKKSAEFVADFAGDVPHEAELGAYSFCQRDRWHGTRPGLLDGWHRGSGWAVRIKGGQPVEAVREDHPAYPKQGKGAAA